MPLCATGAPPQRVTLEAASATEPDLQTDSITISIKLCNLPPFNGIAAKVLALTSDPDIDLKRLSSLIEGDPAFAAEILFLANSSLFGFRSRMHVLRHAIAILGLDRVKTLAETVAMRGFLGDRSPLVHQCWRHSAACALVCEQISSWYDFSRERAYTAGIMHDIGRLGLLKSYPQESALVLGGEYQDAGEVFEAEGKALNVDHGSAGAWLIESWGLPDDFSEVCEHHHHAPRTGDSAILQLVRVACGMADAIGFPAVKYRRQLGYLEAASELAAKLGRKAVPPEEELRAVVTARLAAFER
jgi:putative nucleotidyltransferase with HDIG domain